MVVSCGDFKMNGNCGLRFLRAVLLGVLVQASLVNPVSPAVAENEPLAISLGVAQREFSVIDDVVLTVEVHNVSDSLIAGLIVGPGPWKDAVTVSVDGQPIPVVAKEAIANEAYELRPGTFVAFMIPLRDYVLSYARDGNALSSRDFRGKYGVSVRLSGVLSDTVEFSVVGGMSRDESERRARHPGLTFLREQRDVLQGVEVPGRGAQRKGTARALGQRIALFVLEHRKVQYSDPLDVTAMGGLTALLRRCAFIDDSLQLTGSYLLARDAFGKTTEADMEAARLEHQALDLIAAGRAEEGIAAFMKIYDLLPNEVAYHVSAVATLAKLGVSWDEARGRIAGLGIDRIQSLPIAARNPGLEFAFGFLSSHLR